MAVIRSCSSHGSARERQRRQQSDNQALNLPGDVIAPPADQRSQPQQQRKRRHQGGEHGIEERLADGDAAEAQLFMHQRQQRPEEHHQHRGHQQDIVANRNDSRDHSVCSTRARTRPPFSGVQQQRTADGDNQQYQNKQPARRIRGEGMHRNQHPGAHQEGAQQAQEKAAMASSTVHTKLPRFHTPPVSASARFPPATA